MALNPYQKYQQQSVMTMTPGEMLTRLFDELIKQLSAFKEYNSQKDYALANDALAAGPADFAAFGCHPGPPV